MVPVAQNKKTKKISYVFSGALLLVLIIGIAFPEVASADIGDLLMIPIKFVLYGIFVTLGALLSAAVGIFEYAVDPSVYGPDGMFNKASVYNMWKFIRDFFNLFFILTLLYTAFTIVFQIAGNYKKTLLSIVLAALFVNFSFPLTRVMIDAANVPMYYFINLIMDSSGGDAKTKAAGALGPALSASGLKNILIPQKATVTGMDVSHIFMAIIFVFVFMVTLMVLSIMLAIRMMMLLVLVMFSAVGFAGSIIPGMKKYSDMWWDKLAQYALFGPAAMFMLYIATQLFSEISKDSSQQTFATKMAANATADTSTFLAAMGMYSITIIMLWIAIGLANSMSIMGASAITGKGQQFLKWAGKSAVMFPARKIDSKLASTKYGQYLSPGAWRMAFKQRSEEQKHNDERPVKLAAATRQDELNNVVSRFTNTITPTNWLPKNWNKLGKNTDHTDHRFAERQSQQAAHAKEMTEVSDRAPIILKHLKNAVAGGNPAEVAAAISVMAKNNDLNDMVLALDSEYGDGSGEVSSKNAKQIIVKLLKEAGVENEDDIAKTLTVLSDQALVSGNYAFGGMSVYKDGTFKVSEDGTGDESQAAQVAGKFNNLEPQKQATMLHPDALFKRNAEGFTDMNDDVAALMAPKISKATSDQSNRSRSDMRSAIQNAWTKTKAGDGAHFPNFVKNYNDNENFRYYVFKMLEQNGNLPENCLDSKKEKGDYTKFNENFASFAEVTEL